MAVLMRTCMITLLLLACSPCAADENLQLQEQEIKAGLLYNFLKYTDWPAAAQDSATITVCIFGDDPFGGYLSPMEGKTVNQRSIAVRTIRDAGAAEGCQLLFVNADEKSRWPELREALAHKSILTVSDLPAFAASGGMIEFGHEGSHIRARMNMGAVRNAGLRVEDRLLRLVSVVHAGQP